MMGLRKHFVSSLLVLSVLLTGCGGGGEVTFTSAEDAFQQGMVHYEEGNYDRAIEHFRGVFTYGRTNEWAADAQLYVARSYKAQRRYRVAATEYGRFMELYSTDERVPIAEYERAMAFYELSPPYQLDQTDTERALSAFQLFVDRYPTHELASDAQERIAELRNKLAQKKYKAGELYEGRNQFQAAIRTYERVFDQYPDTDWADEAILALIRTYISFSDQSVEQRQPERLQEAIEWYHRLAQVFPDSTLLSDAEEHYERAMSRLEQLGESPAVAQDASSTGR